MLSHIYRDAETLPALAQVLRGAHELLAPVVATLASELGTRGKRSSQAEAALALSFAFHSWRSLDQSGLATPEAAALMAKLIRSI